MERKFKFGFTLKWIWNKRFKPKKFWNIENVCQMGECIHIYIYTLWIQTLIWQVKKDPLLRVVCWQYLHILNFSTSPMPTSCIIDLLNDFWSEPILWSVHYSKGVCALFSCLNADCSSQACLWAAHYVLEALTCYGEMYHFNLFLVC